MSNSTRNKLLASVAALLMTTACGIDLEDSSQHGTETGVAAPKGNDALPKGSAAPAPVAEVATAPSEPEAAVPVATSSGSASEALPSHTEDPPVPAPTPAPAPAPAPALPDDPNALKFGKDILPILTAKCSECHHAGSPHTSFAAFPFRAGDMKAYAQTLLAAAQPGQGRMPPGPRTPLSAAEYGLLQKWVADGLRP